MFGINTTTYNFAKGHGPEGVRAWWLWRFSVVLEPEEIGTHHKEGTLAAHWYWKEFRAISGFIFSCRGRKLFLQYHHGCYPPPFPLHGEDIESLEDTEAEHETANSAKAISDIATGSVGTRLDGGA